MSSIIIPGNEPLKQPKKVKRKSFTPEELKAYIREELKGLDPWWQEIGKLFEGICQRVDNIEEIQNTILQEYAEQRKKNAPN